jgi:hypothetical protein
MLKHQFNFRFWRRAKPALVRRTLAPIVFFSSLCLFTARAGNEIEAWILQGDFADQRAMK